MGKTSTTILLSLILIVMATLLLHDTAYANYYKYTDSSGAVVITNSKQSIPARYRGSMKVITEESLDKKDPAARKPVPQHDPEPEEAAPAKEAAAAPAAVPEGRFAQLAARFPWFKPVVYILGVLAAFLVVQKVGSLLPTPQLARLLSIVFFLGVIVFVYKAYVDYIATSYSTIKTKAIDTLKKSNQREVPQPGEPGAPPTAAPGENAPPPAGAPGLRGAEKLPD